MKRQIKKYSRPLKPWDKERIETEKKFLTDYGLRRKKEIWRAESILRNFKRMAREQAYKKDKESEAILLDRLNRMGLISIDSSLDDVLALTLEKVLERRLQTMIYRKGIASTLKQARQYIVHGHIAIDGARMRWPSHLVKADEESKISFYAGSAVKEDKIKKVVEAGKEPTPTAGTA
jgi:small subunit ribosomal protein S4